MLQYNLPDFVDNLVFQGKYRKTIQKWFIVIGLMNIVDFYQILPAPKIWDKNTVLLEIK